jgi:hypothetical protein
VKLTSVNVFCMSEALREGNGVIRRVPAVDVPHLKRCIAAGALVPGTEPRTWVASEMGAKLVAEFEAKRGGSR